MARGEAATAWKYRAPPPFPTQKGNHKMKLDDANAMYLGDSGWVGPALGLKHLLRALRDKGVLSDDEIDTLLNDVRSEVAGRDQ
jgi:hypothetical protein